MKTTPLKLSSLILLMTLQYIAHADEYCESGSDGNQLIWIESLYSGPFTNETGPIQFPQDDQDHLYIAYWNYSHLPLDWQEGINQLELHPGLLIENLTIYWQVWIDINADNNFSPDELMAVQTGGSSPVNLEINLSDLSITEPLSTRMRITASYYENTPACGSIGHGEVEDYQLVISPPLQNTLRVPEEYASIQDAVDAALPGERILVNDGDYAESVWVDKPLLIESVNGQQTTSVRGFAQPHSFIVESPDVTIKGFGIYLHQNPYSGVIIKPGAHRSKVIDSKCLFHSPAFYYGFGVLIDQANEVTVDNFNCDGGFRLHGLIRAENTNGSRFINNYVTKVLSDALYVKSGNEIEISGNDISYSDMSGINILDSSNLLITENISSFNIRYIPPSRLAGKHGIRIHNSHGVDVLGNESESNKENSINITDSSEIYLLNNSISMIQEAGIYISNSTYTLIDNNLITPGDNNSIRGIKINSSEYITVSNNELEDLSLNLSFVDNSIFQNNYLYGHRQPITMHYSNSNTFHQNVVEVELHPAVPCKLRITEGIDNRLFANEFAFNPFEGICVNSATPIEWNSEDPLLYTYQGEAYSGYVGNYYLIENAQDNNGDGIAEQPVIISGVLIDENPLLQTLTEYEFFE